MIDVVLGHGARMPSPMSAIHLYHMGGAVARVGPACTAFSGRTAAYTYNLISTWTDPAQDGLHIGANRDMAADLAPHSQDGSYVNFLTDTAGDSTDTVQAAYGDALYGRLARLKREFDPGNLFRANHNIRPAR